MGEKENYLGFDKIDAGMITSFTFDQKHYNKNKRN